MLPIAVDVMGGDFGPRPLVEGVGQALDLLPDAGPLLLVGDEAQVRAELTRLGKAGDPRLSVVHADAVMEMDDPATAALRGKAKASITVAVDLVKKGLASAVVSAGHTGASVAASVVKLRMLPGIDRPGIATVFPTATGRFVLLDAGANVDAKPEHLVHYAVMGDMYARHILGVDKPRVGLLSVGTENEKGNELTKAAFKLLQAVPHIQFIGNVEGHDLFEGHVDVVVCDGFVGNVVLKTSESLAKAIAHILKDKLSKTVIRKLGALLSSGAYRELKQVGDYAEYGGAPLLGVNGVVIIGHGSSSPKAMRNAIRVAREFITHDVNAKIIREIEGLRLS
ncbi:MAG: phosphate acyltransferase PlsX [Lentisphaeria bacterium]